jgi:hypothetical protein
MRTRYLSSGKVPLVCHTAGYRIANFTSETKFTENLEAMLGKKQQDEIMYDDLAAMMADYAKQAVQLAEKQYRRHLDYSESSVDVLEEIVSEVIQDIKPDEAEQHVRLWGAYFGEFLRKRYLGEWTISTYPGGASAVPTIEIYGSRLFPLMKLYRRLTIGSDENLVTFYRMIAAKFGDPTKVN